MTYTEWPHRRLNVWKKAMLQAREVYEKTRSYPRNEQYGLSSQMQRAAVSVPSNIAEGLARPTPKDKVRFLYGAQGSLSELDTQVELSCMVGYISEGEKEALQIGIHEIQMLLTGLIRSIQN